MLPVENKVVGDIIRRDKEEQTVLDCFLKTIKEKLDDKIGQDIYVSLFKAALRDCEVIKWTSEGEETYRLELAHAYQASTPDGTGKTWFLEKEIVCRFVSDNYQIILPRVKEFYDTKKSIDPKNKNLNGIWASETVLGCVYTGVGYSIRWDASNNQIITDNINDGSWMMQKLITPQIKSLQTALQEWNIRDRKPID